MIKPGGAYVANVDGRGVCGIIMEQKERRAHIARIRYDRLKKVEAAEV